MPTIFHTGSLEFGFSDSQIVDIDLVALSVRFGILWSLWSAWAAFAYLCATLMVVRAGGLEFGFGALDWSYLFCYLFSVVVYCL